MNKNNDKRIMDIEIYIAQLENITTDLSDMMNEQWKVIDVLKRDVKNLKDFININLNQGDSNIANEPPPPHY